MSDKPVRFVSRTEQELRDQLRIAHRQIVALVVLIPFFVVGLVVTWKVWFP